MCLSWSVHLLVQEPLVKKQKKSGRRPQLKPGCDDEQQNAETGDVGNEDGLADGTNDMKVTDTSSYWPRNRESAASAKTEDLNSLFPFERKAR